jgi:hypothetical protein
MQGESFEQLTDSSARQGSPLLALETLKPFNYPRLMRVENLLSRFAREIFPAISFDRHQGWSFTRILASCVAVDSFTT